MLKSKIYTKTGDKGETSLLSGERVKKNHVRVETYGTVDELNSNIGLLIAQIDAEFHKELYYIQNALFNLGSDLANLKSSKQELLIGEKEIAILEKKINEMDSHLPKLNKFILPSGNIAISQCHIVRCICRRAERLCVSIDSQNISNLIFLNRLSDYFFILARFIAYKKNIPEYYWEKYFDY